MTEQWLAENLNRLDKEELADLDNLSTKIKYSVVGPFSLMLVPQYILINRAIKNNLGVKNFKVAFLTFLPFLASQAVSYPYKVSYQEYIEKLIAKYS